MPRGRDRCRAVQDRIEKQLQHIVATIPRPLPAAQGGAHAPESVERPHQHTSSQRTRLGGRRAPSGGPDRGNETSLGRRPSRRVVVSARCRRSQVQTDGVYVNVAQAMRACASRCFAVTAMIAFAVAQLVGFAHSAAVRHVLCAHGELIDAPEIATDTKTHTKTQQWGALDGPGSGDTHCAIASSIRQPGTTSDVPHLPAPLQIAAVAVAGAGVLDRLAIASLYRIAPKTSPPRSSLL
jgi:hypothetical protein